MNNRCAYYAHAYTYTHIYAYAHTYFRGPENTDTSHSSPLLQRSSLSSHVSYFYAPSSVVRIPAPNSTDTCTHLLNPIIHLKKSSDLLQLNYYRKQTTKRVQVRICLQFSQLLHPRLRVYSQILVPQLLRWVFFPSGCLCCSFEIQLG